MTLSVKVRFEVLKRDRYTCSYCGKHPPEVLLEVDHIHPVAAGGTDDLENLTTACLDCNRGKGARLLEEGIAPVVNRGAIEEMRERVEQAQAYMELLGSMRSITDEQLWRVKEAWARTYGAAVEERSDGSYWTFANYGYFPEDRSIRSFLRKLTLDQVLEAVDITASRIRNPSMDAVRYFYGVCHRSIREGREPLTQQTPDHEEALADGRSWGVESERRRLGSILTHYQEHGYATLEEAVTALWPEDD